jgi:hypothetical protein
MATYDAAAVSDAVIAFKKGITLQQGRALRDNPIAIAEGATGAPRVEGRALDTFMGTLSLVDTTATGFIDLDRFELIRAVGDIDEGASQGIPWWLQIRFSNDNGSSYGSYQDISIIASSGNAVRNIEMFFNMRTGAGRFIHLTNNALTLTVPANANAFQMRFDLSGRTGTLSFFCFGGLTA